MKRTNVRKNYKLFIGFIFGLVISGTGVYAVTTISGSEIGYTDSHNLGVDNVQSAIDKIYEKSKNCPAGYNCKKNQTCSGDNCKKCVRATSLHTEICSQTSTDSYCRADGYSTGSTIAYGSTGTSGKLSTGDAFDCDVNGDGEYDAEKERFYYVTDMNENTAVLIYYNNVWGGVANNQATYAYNTDTSGYLGPATAIKQLPTTTQWSNISLTNTIRNITDESGTVRVPGFSYVGKSSRLLTYQEVNEGCYDGITAITTTKGLSGKCKFLMENTEYSSSSMATYGIWLETLSASYMNYAWYVYGSEQTINYNFVSNTSHDGVRPAIEVLKSDIAY